MDDDYQRSGDDYDDYQGSGADYDDYQGGGDDQDDYQGGDDYDDYQGGNDENTNYQGGWDDLDYDQGSLDSHDHGEGHDDRDERHAVHNDKHHGDHGGEEYQGNNTPQRDGSCDLNDVGQRDDPDHRGMERQYTWGPCSDGTPNSSHDRFFSSQGRGHGSPHQRRLIGGCGRSRGRGRGGLEPQDRPVGVKPCN